MCNCECSSNSKCDCGGTCSCENCTRTEESSCDECTCDCNDCDCQYEFEFDNPRTPLIGRKLGNRTLDAFYKDDIRQIKLSDYRGKWVVIVFYPADFTFVCPTELQDLAELYPEFQKEGAELFTVSTDTAYTHLAWHGSSKAVGMVEFPMLADPAGKLARELGVYLEDEGLALRGSFIIDPDGIVKTMQIHDNSIGRSGAELLRTLRAAKFVREHNGEVCPANWRPGEKTLKPGSNLVGKI